MSSTKPEDLIAEKDMPVFKSLFKTKPFVHAMAMVYNWIIIFTVTYLYLQLSIVWLYPVAIIVIGARMHALAILMHDATHYRFIKNRKWSDLISNLVIMYPLFSSIEKYRSNHLPHHQHLNTHQDPDWVAKLSKREFQFPKTKIEFLLTLSSYLVLYQGILDALWFLKRYGGSKEKVGGKPENTVLKISFYVVLFASLTLFQAWTYFLLFWIIPYLTSFFMFQYIRSVAEHFGELAYEDDLSSSRTVKPSLLEKFLIAPHQVGYHLEHHLYPGVPYYHLPELHQLLMRQREYQTRAHITLGYMSGLLQELGRVD